MRGSRRSCPRRRPPSRRQPVGRVRGGASAPVEADGGDAVGPGGRSCPSKAATGRPRRSTSQPVRPGDLDRGGGVVRVEHPHLEATGLASHGRHLGAPDGEGRAPVGPVAASERRAWSPGGRARRRPAGRDRRPPRRGRSDTAIGPIICGPSSGVIGPAVIGRVVMPSRDSMPVARSRVRASAVARAARARRPRRGRPARTRAAPRGPRSGRRSRRTGGRGRSACRTPRAGPRPLRPRSTTVKAHSAREVAAGRGRGRWTRTRWSLDGLSNSVCTRTIGSSARTSRVVTTGTSWRTHPRGAGLVHPIGPGEGGGDGDGGPNRSPVARPSTSTESGRSTTESTVGGE